MFVEKIKGSVLFLLIVLLATQAAVTQSVAQKRSERLRVGMSVSYLEN